MSNRLKHSLAKTVYSAVHRALDGRSTFTGDTVKVSKASELVTHIKVEPQHGAPRWFEVRVSEKFV